MKRLEDRIAVVTGAASGIGRATALELARKGCHLALADVNEDGVGATAEQVRALGRRASSHSVDVADRAAMERFAADVLAEHGAVHIVVNNAGVAILGSFEEHSLEDLDWLLGINLWGVIYGCKLFLPALREADEGHIVNISSVAGFQGLAGMSSYCASKFAVRGLTEALRHEIAQYDIGATSVHPGVIATNIPTAARTTADALESHRQRGVRAFERFGHSPD